MDLLFRSPAGGCTPVGMGKRMRLLISAIALAASVQSASAAEQHPDWDFSELRHVPVQSGGRVKPLDSHVRETILFATGSRKFQGWDSMDLVLSWMSEHGAWESKPFVQINREDVRRQLLLDDKRTRFSPQELFQNPALLQYARGMEGGGARQVSEPTGRVEQQNPRDQELKRALSRLGVFRNVVEGQAFPIIPQPAPQPWLGLGSASESPRGEPIQAAFTRLLEAYRSGQKESFAAATAELRKAVQGQMGDEWNASTERLVSLEVVYNRMRPFQLAWIFYLLGALAWAAVPAFSKRPRVARAFAWSATLVAFLLHVAGMTLRSVIAGRPPVSNMYESVIWVAFGVILFALILYRFQRQIVLLATGCAVATLCLIAGDAAPAVLDPTINPLVPVLRSNYWLTIHVLTITLGYSAFALTLGISNVTLYHFIRHERTQERQRTIASLNQLNYRSMQFGVVLLAAGTILGGVWADESWGRFWGWDPKEVWALIALLCYLVILHARYTGWVAQFSFAAWSIVAFLSVLMAWYGVNFILGAGLHSYGFASGGTPTVVAFSALQVLYVGLAAFMHWRREGTARKPKSGPTQGQLAPETK